MRSAAHLLPAYLPGYANPLVACLHVRAAQVLTAERASRDFAEVLDSVKSSKAKVVAVTSQERADAAEKERPGFFDKVHKVL